MAPARHPLSVHSPFESLRKSDVFEFYFKPACGKCHVGGAAQGGLTVSLDNLGEHVDKSLERIRSENLKLVMPQESQPRLLRDRGESDTVSQFAVLLDAWVKSGKKDAFSDPRTATGTEATALARSATTLGQALTNLGTCIPAKRIVGTEVDEMRALDAMFAAMTDISQLPDKLSATDLFTLDSEELAKRGVLSFAPGYTLWADDAKKMRYVRVPQGQSISFSVATQSFDMPENTRFYKTFLKEVTDLDGQTRYKRIETRIIVARRGLEQPGQNLPQINALYGTYRWNEEETEAVLERTPLNNGKPFRDHLLWYLKNEQEAQPIIDMAKGDSPGEKLEKAKDKLLQKGFARHYAIPGSQRCEQCHMGGPDGKFQLGFLPLQIWRRPKGEGGVIETSYPDELTQLARFQRYGVITGIESPQKLLPLEKSQGARSPRTDYELVAQGYMLGNCASCHNPNGYATRATDGVLRDYLDFYPSADGGGIFEFPLERTSPRIRRTLKADSFLTLPSGERAFQFSVPYITPSLYDHPMAVTSTDFAPHTNAGNVLAPWRSLIYRNVDSNFTYSGGSTIYPHMPLHTSGVDCRLPRIMAEWMLSIPAVTKSTSETTDGAWNTDDQPYREVRPGDSGYESAKVSGALRIAQYHDDAEYAHCFSNKDIVDYRALTNPVRFPEPSPETPHFVVTDLSVAQGPWQPRHPQWEDTLVRGIVNLPANAPLEKGHELAMVLEVLAAAQLTQDRRDFALTPVAFGLWVEKPECANPLVSQRTVASFSPDRRWGWLSEVQDPNAHVYMQAPGEALSCRSKASSPTRK